MRLLLLLLSLLLLLAYAPPTHARDALPPCDQRPTRRELPLYDSARWCLETVVQDDQQSADLGWLLYTALASAPDGTLYAARPLEGELYAIRDSDGDLLPDTPELFVSGLTLPNGLTYHDAALYVSGGANIYRVTLDGTVTVLVDDVPAGDGFWTGGLVFGDDGRLYVATGAPCDRCTPDDPLRGALLSFAPDGSDRRIVATGLRAPYGVAQAAGALWVTDSAPDDTVLTDADELNRVTDGANFGFPDCIGGSDCPGVTPPALRLPTSAHPLGLAAYRGAAFPDLQGALLLVLGGSPREAGFAPVGLVAVYLDGAGLVVESAYLLPGIETQRYPGTVFPRPSPVLRDAESRGWGMASFRPLAVTVDAQGWIYLSVGGGRIYALRP